MGCSSNRGFFIYLFYISASSFILMRRFSEIASRSPYSSLSFENMTGGSTVIFFFAL